MDIQEKKKIHKTEGDVGYQEFIIFLYFQKVLEWNLAQTDGHHYKIC